MIEKYMTNYVVTDCVHSFKKLFLPNVTDVTCYISHVWLL